MGLSCGLCVLPVKRKLIPRSLAALAAIGFSSNNWAFLAGGILLLIAADGISGPLVQKKKHAKFHKTFRGMFLVGIMNLKSMLPLALSLPIFAVYSAYSIRQAPESVMGASGKVLLLGTFGSLFLCLISWSSVCFLALTPLILNLGTTSEKHQKVSQWLELHHLAAGDSLSWSE